MRLLTVINSYIAFERSIGMRFRSQPRLLRGFCRTMGEIDIGDVQTEAVASFLSGHGKLTCTWRLRYSVLKSFYRFAVSRGYVTASPLPAVCPELPEPLRPYIYSTAELISLVEATEVLVSVRNPLQVLTYRTLLLLLYSTGIRIGEALALTVDGVDLANQLLTIRNSKFFKSRLVPTGPRMTALLSEYMTERMRFPFPAGTASAFFCTHLGTPVSYQHAITLFQRVRSRAGIHREPEASYPPRLHDLRHTAAVHRLIHWYKTDADVQRLLPQLATYLGHLDLRSTQRYLTTTSELLQEASVRFERYAQLEDRHA